MESLMKEVGYSDSSAKRSTQVIRSEGFCKLLIKAGITAQDLARKLKEGLNATKVISCNVIAPNGEGMKDANSMTKDFVDVEDYGIRHKYLMTALELNGLIARNGINLQFGDRNTKIDINAQKIIIHRSPGHRPLKKVETVDVKAKGENDEKG